MDALLEETLAYIIEYALPSPQYSLERQERCRELGAYSQVSLLWRAVAQHTFYTHPWIITGISALAFRAKLLKQEYTWVTSLRLGKSSTESRGS